MIRSKTLLSALAATAATGALALVGGGAGTPTAHAASHSDAPLIKLDPQANLTDVYSFITSPGGVKMLNIVVHVRPLSEPGDGPHYDKFSPDALYSIHIANPTTGATVRRYDFRFSDVSSASGNYKNLDTILSYGRGTAVGPINSNTDATRNYTQTYSVSRVQGNGNASTTLATGLITPPPNVGLRTTPAYNNSATGFAVSGATTVAGLDVYTREAIHTLSSGERVFSGPREDGFFADIGGIFDLLNPRILGSSLGQAGGGVDLFKGYNVLAYSIQIPVSSLPSFSYTTPALIGGAQTGVGVYASVSRPRVTLRRTNGDDVPSGPFVQVNRMANPLFNEVLVALRDKDNYNRTMPGDDTAYAKYALNPEVAVLINTVFGTNFATTGRADLAAIFLGSEQRADVLRVNTATNAVPLAGQTGFNRLSFVGGDAQGSVPNGWPNGRRFGDDVIDIALTAVASGPSYTTITVVGDNVNMNDQVYHQVFPYSATPHSGTHHAHHESGENSR
jgi:hypothetical protein